jgi:hypothetical protein
VGRSSVGLGRLARGREERDRGSTPEVGETGNLARLYSKVPRNIASW